MKENLQKELLEKVKPGTKPSDLRKLKRSKSDSDIPSPLNKGSGVLLPKISPLQKSQSQLETPITTSSSKLTITQLQEQIKFHAETAQNYLKSLQIAQSKVSELEEKL